MARIARVVLPGVAHHITQRGVRSIDIFYKHEDRQIYKDILHTQCKRFKVKIISYCLMTNHVHLILIPSTESSLARAVGETHSDLSTLYRTQTKKLLSTHFVS